MGEANVVVRVLDLPGASGACACSDLSLTPQYAMALQVKIDELRAAIADAYGDKVRVEYLDLRDAPEEKEGKLGQLLVTRQYPSPLVVIDGEPKFAGSILVKKIVREVGALLNV